MPNISINLFEIRKYVCKYGFIRQRDQEKEVELQKLSEVTFIFIHTFSSSCQMNKKKLLEDMAEEESRNDSKLVELQKQRESERRILNSRWFLDPTILILFLSLA